MATAPLLICGNINKNDYRNASTGFKTIKAHAATLNSSLGVDINQDPVVAMQIPSLLKSVSSNGAKQNITFRKKSMAMEYERKLWVFNAASGCYEEKAFKTAKLAEAWGDQQDPMYILGGLFQNETNIGKTSFGRRDAGMMCGLKADNPALFGQLMSFNTTNRSCQRSAAHRSPDLHRAFYAINYAQLPLGNLKPNKDNVTPDRAEALKAHVRDKLNYIMKTPQGPCEKLEQKLIATGLAQRGILRKIGTALGASSLAETMEKLKRLKDCQELDRATAGMARDMVPEELRVFFASAQRGDPYAQLSANSSEAEVLAVLTDQFIELLKESARDGDDVTEEDFQSLPYSRIRLEVLCACKAVPREAIAIPECLFGTHFVKDIDSHTLTGTQELLEALSWQLAENTYFESEEEVRHYIHSMLATIHMISTPSVLHSACKLPIWFSFEGLPAVNSAATYWIGKGIFNPGHGKRAAKYFSIPIVARTWVVDTGKPVEDVETIGLKGSYEGDITAVDAARLACIDVKRYLAMMEEPTRTKHVSLEYGVENIATNKFVSLIPCQASSTIAEWEGLSPPEMFPTFDTHPLEILRTARLPTNAHTLDPEIVRSLLRGPDPRFVTMGNRDDDEIFHPFTCTDPGNSKEFYEVDRHYLPPAALRDPILRTIGNTYQILLTGNESESGRLGLFNVVYGEYVMGTDNYADIPAFLKIFYSDADATTITNGLTQHIAKNPAAGPFTGEVPKSRKRRASTSPDAEDLAEASTSTASDQAMDSSA